MATEQEFVTFKEFASSLELTENPTNDDVSVVSNSTDGPRSTPGSGFALTTNASDADFNDESVVEIKTPNGRKKAKSSLFAKQSEVDFVQASYPRNKIVNRGKASVVEVCALDEKQNGWCYELTDSGFVNNGTTLVNAGEYVVWDASNDLWGVVKPDVGVGINDDVDFAVSDDEGNAVMKVENGFLKTKNFDSELAVKNVSVEGDTLILDI